MRLALAIGLLVVLTAPVEAQSRSAADTSPSKVVEQVEAAYWAKDVKKLMSFYAPNAEGYRLARGDSALKGPLAKERMRVANAEVFKQYPKQHGRVLATIVNGSYVVRQYVSEDEQSGGPVTALWIFEVQGGKIRRTWHAPGGEPLPAGQH